MQITQQQLDNHLKNKLSCAYLISTDVTFLATEAREKIINAAKLTGYDEHCIFHIETGFQVESILNVTQNQSLFSEKKIIDIRNLSSKFDDELIVEIEKADDSNLFIMTTEKLTAAQQKAKWFLAIQKIGVYLPIFPIERQSLTQWIMDRCKKLDLPIDKNSADLLADCTEGNLAATQQAIEKLSLLYPNQKKMQENLSAVLIDNARFTIFDLSKYYLSGDAKQVIKIISLLQKTEGELPLVLWMVTKDIRELIALHRDPQAIQKVWGFKKPLFQVALKNCSLHSLKNGLVLSSKIDQMFKGFLIGNAWENLLSLCLMFCKRCQE